MPEKYEAVAEKWLNPVLRGYREWMCACAFCPGTQSLQFNVKTGLWLCFRCGEKGTAQILVERLGGSYTNPVLGIDMIQESLNSLRKEVREKRRGTRYDSVPEKYLARFQGKPHPYWSKQRRFSRRTITEWELGYDPIGPKLWSPEKNEWVSIGKAVTLPYRTPDGDLLGVFHRRLDDGFPRYVYPKGFDRTGSMFGSWMIEQAESGLTRVVLVEGSTDAIRVHQVGFQTLGQYGSSLHRDQVKLLRRLGVNEIVLFYDYDASGLKATTQALSVLDGFIVRSVEWDTELFCWHGKLCNCGEGHNPIDLGFCKRKKDCRCGRMHDADPGDWRKLSDSDITQMVENAPLRGRQKTWRSSSERRRFRRRSSAQQAAARTSRRRGWKR